MYFVASPTVAVVSRGAGLRVSRCCSLTKLRGMHLMLQVIQPLAFLLLFAVCRRTITALRLRALSSDANWFRIC